MKKDKEFKWKRFTIGFHLRSDAIQIGIQYRWNELFKNTLNIGLFYLMIQVDYRY